MMRRCPACGGSESREEWLCEPMAIHMQEFCLPDGCRLPALYDLRLCLCGCAYADVNDAAAYDHYYREFDVYQHVEKEEKAVADAFRLSLRCPPGATALDYGCGNGRLAELLRDAVDVSTYDHATGVTTNAKPHYSLAYSMHVLEHAIDPLAIMLTLAKLADEVYVEVPDSDRYADDVLQEINAEHINHFTPHSLSVLFARAGLEVVAVERGTANVGVTTGTRYPVLRMIGAGGGFRVGVETRRPMFVQNYVMRGRRRLSAIRRQVAELPRFAIWGVGQLAWKVLTFCRHEQVVMLADSSPAVQCRRFGGFGAVHDPSELPSDVPVLACSAVDGGIRKAAEERGLEVIGLAHA